ncbi:CarD family transcriptional regulator [Microvirga roseola]|uniref:CarD family transcriptional regulator n=1 Tax=Microvirga roseola TaxID=2883126 RepID=UPI001E5B4522|nr:CarD family transcriptional regulator [Microvirga roseola]
MTITKKIAHLDFKVGETVIYPTHGVGLITAIEEQEVAGFKLELLIVFFEKEKLTLRVPLAKVSRVGMRKLSEPATVNEALELLTGRARSKRGMWNRRVTEYQEKISSGNLTLIAEVVRDLHRGPAQDDASFSERGIYDSALDLLVRETAAVNGSTATEAQKLIEQNLAKAPATTKSAPADDLAEGSDIKSNHATAG